MSNVLSEEKRQQILALGRLGWTLRRIEQATGVRRETAGTYLKAAGIAVRPPGGWGRKAPAKPAIEVTTDFDGGSPINETITDSRPPNKKPVSACEPYREVIEAGLNLGRNAMAIWQDLVDRHGFDRGYQSVKRYLHKLCPLQTSQARPVIVTAPGEECQVDYGTGPMAGSAGEQPARNKFSAAPSIQLPNCGRRLLLEHRRSSDRKSLIGRTCWTRAQTIKT